MSQIHVQWWHFLTAVGYWWFWWCFITKVWSVDHIIIVIYINGVCYGGWRLPKCPKFTCSGRILQGLPHICWARGEEAGVRYGRLGSPSRTMWHGSLMPFLLTLLLFWSALIIAHTWIQALEFLQPPPLHFFWKFIRFGEGLPPLARLWLEYQTKGSQPLPDLQFFWTLFKKPLTPPPSFWTSCCKFFLMDFLKSA